MPFSPRWTALGTKNKVPIPAQSSCPARYLPGMNEPTIQSLTIEITDLFASVAAQKRLLKEQRVALGKQLIKLRAMFSVQNTSGTFRGSHKGAFCAHVVASGWNLGTCYDYIDLAEGKKPAPVKEAFWQAMNRKLKKAKDGQKIALLRQAIAHLIKLYEIPATAVVTRVKQ